MAQPDPRPADIQAAATDDRRRAERRPSESRMSIIVPEQVLEGRVENTSESGLFLFAEGRVTVEVVIAGERRRGRLVRLQTINGRETGLAIELDRA